MDLKDETIVELFFDVNRLNRHYSELTYGRLNPFRGQYRCLFMLDDTGSINQKELAILLGIRQASLSDLLLKLEQKQLIKRCVSEKDRRVSLVSLTDSGKTEVKKIRRARAKTHSEMLSGLTPEEKESLFTALQKMKHYYTSKEMPIIHE